MYSTHTIALKVFRDIKVNEVFQAFIWKRRYVWLKMFAKEFVFVELLQSFFLYISMVGIGWYVVNAVAVNEQKKKDFILKWLHNSEHTHIWTFMWVGNMYIQLNGQENRVSIPLKFFEYNLHIFTTEKE